MIQPTQHRWMRTIVPKIEKNLMFWLRRTNRSAGETNRKRNREQGALRFLADLTPCGNWEQLAESKGHAHAGHDGDQQRGQGQNLPVGHDGARVNAGGFDHFEVNNCAAWSSLTPRKADSRQKPTARNSCAALRIVAVHLRQFGFGFGYLAGGGLDLIQTRLLHSQLGAQRRLPELRLQPKEMRIFDKPGWWLRRVRRFAQSAQFGLSLAFQLRDRTAGGDHIRVFIGEAA